MARLSILVILLSAFVPEGYELVDSLVYVPVSAVDTTLVGASIREVMPENVGVRESAGSRGVLERYTDGAEERTVPCYRIRIFFDNKQNSREASEEALERFRALFPGVAAYRSFQDPFFKVTVGDFRSRSEALAQMDRVRRYFPTAFIVRERMRFPSVGDLETFRVDTVQVLKSISE